MAVRAVPTLLAVEALAVIALIFAPLPITIPIALPLLVAASLSRWVRGRSWGEHVGSARSTRLHALAVGAVAGALALAAATPLFGAFHVTAVEWWLAPAARGDAGQLALAIGYSIVTAAALELALRGWVLERVWELSPGPPVLPIVTAALIEALVIDGPIASRIGAGLFGIGLGLLHVANRRNVLAPIAARACFATGAIVIELVRA